LVTASIAVATDYYAQFVPVIASGNVVAAFYDFDGAYLGAVEVVSGATPVPPVIPTRSGFVFDGWSPVLGAISVNTMYTATYTVVVPVFGDYIVTYDGNGYTGGLVPYDGRWYFDGELVTVLGQGSLIKVGCSFLGWSTNPADTVAMFTAGSTFAIYNDVTLYAIWAHDIYTVTYEPGTHGTFTQQVTGNLHYGDATPTAPTTTGETGWTFNGWLPTLSATVTGTVTYTAQWTQTTTPSTPPPTTPPATTPPATTIPASDPTLPPSTDTTKTPAATSTPTPPPKTSDDQRIPPVDKLELSVVNSLVSVIGIIIAAVAAVWILLINRNLERQGTQKTGNENIFKRWITWLIIAVALSIVSIIVFFITQDTSLPFGWITDKWTIPHAAILIIEIIALYISLQTKKHA
jgi:hypothetical protein